LAGRVNGGDEGGDSEAARRIRAGSPTSARLVSLYDTYLPPIAESGLRGPSRQRGDEWVGSGQPRRRSATRGRLWSPCDQNWPPIA